MGDEPETDQTVASTKDILVDLDMEERDPNELNLHIGGDYFDIIGEPEGAHSADCVWRNSFKCFHGGKNCCYKCLTFVCAIPMALIWGCSFACLTFSHIWYITPYITCFNQNFACVAKLFSTCVHCFCDPCAESTSLIFTNIFIHTVNDSQGYQSKNPESLNQIRGKPKDLFKEARE